MTPQQIKAMKQALEALKNNKLTHLYCEDTWYSCPKHEYGCANEAEGDECNCGADDVNAQFDQAITALEEALAQPEQEPDKYMMDIECTNCGTKQSGILTVNTTPPQRKPLTDDEIADEWEKETGHSIFGGDQSLGRAMYISPNEVVSFVRNIEAAHGIKE